jgi:hypothetical protein
VGEGTPGVSAMVVGDLLLEFSVSGSKPRMSSVRLQTSSCCSFVIGVAPFRLDVLPGMAGIVEGKGRKGCREGSRSVSVALIGDRLMLSRGVPQVKNGARAGGKGEVR